MNEGNGSRPPRNSATRWTARLGLAGVTVLAAWASYLHALIVVRAADGRTMVAGFIPAVADLLIAAASANLLDASRRGERWPRVSVVAIVVAIGMTITFNVAAGSPHAVPSWLVNVWPPVAFILALESFMGHVRRGRGALSPRSTGAAPATHGHPEPPGTDDALRVLLATGSRRGLAGALGVPRSRVDAWAARVAPVAGNVPAGELPGSPPAPAGAHLNGDSGHG